MNKHTHTPLGWLAALIILMGSANLSAQTSPESNPSDTAATKSSKEAPIELAPFEVSASSNVGYGAKTTSSSGRFVQAYIDVPQSMGVITSEFMDDFGLKDSRAALQLAQPGVFIGPESIQGRVYVRGVMTNQLYVDGVAASGGIYGSNIMPAQFYDRIEVVKGPSSAAFGLGQPGGMVNYISKTPQGTNTTRIATDLAVDGGSHTGYGFSVDSQGTVGNSGKLLYRFVAMHNDNKIASYGGVRNGETGAQLALEYQYSDKTTWQMIVGESRMIHPGTDSIHQYYDEDFAKAAGLWPFQDNPNPTHVLPRILDLQDRVYHPGYDDAEIRLFRASLTATHNFSDNTSIRNAMVVDSLDTSMRYTFPSVDFSAYTSTDPVVQTKNFMIQWPTHGHSFTDAVDFTHRGELRGGIRYQTLLGLNYHRSNLWQSFGIMTGRPSFNPYNPNPVDINAYIDPNKGDADLGFLTLGAGNTYYEVYGWFAQQEVSMFSNRITLSASVRNDRVNNWQTFGGNYVIQPKGWQNTGLVPRYAITFKPREWLSVYALYTEHKDPEASVFKYNVQGRELPQDLFPGIKLGELLTYSPGGTTKEVGVKADLFGGRVTASVAAYRANYTGTLFYGPPSGTYIWPDGSTTSYGTQYVGGPWVEGVEVQVTGTITNRLAFDVRYATINGRDINFPDGNPVYIGLPDTFGLNAKYNFGNRPGNGFSALFGLAWFGSSLIAQNVNLSAYGSGGNPHAYVYKGAQYYLDGGISYGWGNGKHTVSLLCNNLLDDTVAVAGINGANSGGFMPVRRFTLTYALKL
ncbi:MAG: TonB-dependent receptor plug domain-containing protein [Opitutaceae bacterium]|nr:TonB-dependent receptor plug domain-containing protein [Opitutaceae bacterium]